jgi:hypothetical protein
MLFPFRPPLGAAFLLACSAAAAQPAAENPEPSVWDQAITEIGDTTAWADSAFWRLVMAPYAPHYRPSEEHQDVWAIGLERQRADQWLAGASFFSNSFGQPSGYVYLGRRYPGLLDVEPLFFQWSAGLMYGYVGKYKSKVPLNVNGFSPGALVTLGWQFSPKVSFAAHALGDAGLMFQFGYDLR